MTPHILHRTLFPALVLLLLAGGRPAAAQESYFMLMFGAQRIPNDPNHAHTFATFVRVAQNGPTPGVPVIEAHTISWLPANLKVRVLSLLPEEGHNFELHETIRWALSDCMRVSLWGPYQIDRELYCRAIRQVQLLESGQVRYKPVDSGYPSDRVSNCIHAVSSIAEGYRVRVLSPGWGETASYVVLQRFRPWIIDQDTVHTWIGSAMHLDSYPIIYRDFEHPRSGGIRRITSAMFGRSRDATPSYGPPVR